MLTDGQTNGRTNGKTDTYVAKSGGQGVVSCKVYHRKYVLAPADKAANNVVVV